ncbi:hypothetical protein [Anabaena azotica]|uniref:Lipoprotein n=1 Tax=Anabaena azotica FACHB-119 TaxID=947527 RepID=A0ABR8CY59_9NOST|nr:hypothetical protein [Anabaena azotica]MBD2499757.1 hypothetical protein [Anabaena azotica FACHB-119]
MLRIYKSTIKLSSVAAIALLFTSCGESKYAQCNKLIKIVNEAAFFGRQYRNNNDAQATQGLTEIASKIDKLNTDMKGLKIQDDELKSYQIRLIKLYQDISKGLNDTATAINKKDIQQTNRLLAALQKSSVEERSIQNDMRNYCLGE